MTRYSGVVGFGRSVETPNNSGVWRDVMTTRKYKGDVIRNSRLLNFDDTVSGDLRVSNSISILADEYAMGHFMEIKYVSWSGQNWVVTNVEAKRPRLIMNLGGIYNGPT